MTKTAYRVVTLKMKLILRIWRRVRPKRVVIWLPYLETDRQTISQTDGTLTLGFEMDDRITQTGRQMALIQADLFK